jgi:hypothetical protein
VLTTGGALSLGGSLNVTSGNILSDQIQAASALISNTLQNATPGTPIGVVNVGGVGGDATAIVFNGDGSATSQKSLVGFATYPVQTTVGAAGGASALPATPTGYLQINISGTVYVLPYYAHA